MSSVRSSCKHGITHELEVTPPSRPSVRQVDRHADIDSPYRTSSLPLDLSVDRDNERIESYVVEMEQGRYE